jgi:cyclopropane-fatty-acyl-phospholipid synthase
VSEAWFQRALDWVERGRVPDAVVRWGIRRLCAERLREEASLAPDGSTERLNRIVDELGRGPIALEPDAANVQHYEVPAAFFEPVLGPRMKYSCCLWPAGVTTLAGAEEASLAETASHAGLADGQRVLELGCGWGSLTLWMAERFPASRVTAVSNSASQRAFVERRAAERGLSNVSVVTCDMNTFRAPGRFDLVVSVEMFEHMRNYGELLRRIAQWLVPRGRLFIHVFAHRRFAYPFETGGAHNWMGRHFFTGGLMPSDDLLPMYQTHFDLVTRWRWNGMEYRRTSEAWLANLDASRDRLRPVLVATYGVADADRWFHRWRLFFLAVAECFGFKSGLEWGVSHYLFERIPGVA